MRYRLRTLVLLTIVGPPVLWGLHAFFKLPGTLYWSAIFLLALLVCIPFAIIKVLAYWRS